MELLPHQVKIKLYCYLKYSNSKLTKDEKSFVKSGKKRSEDCINDERPTSTKVLRSGSTPHFPNQKICVCGQEHPGETLIPAGAPVLVKPDSKKDKENVLQQTNYWRQMATALNHSRILFSCKVHIFTERRFETRRLVL